MHDSPDAVVRDLLDAVERERWLDAARLVHPDALDRHRAQMLAMVRPGTELAPWAVTPEMLMRTDPGMPLEVAEYQARRAEASMGEHRRLILDAVGVGSIEALEALDPAELFARQLAANDERTAFAQAAAAAVDDPAFAEMIARTGPSTRRSVIGRVNDKSAEEPEVAYVAYRADYGRHATAERISVVAVRRADGDWRVDPGEMGAGFMSAGNFSITVESSGAEAFVREIAAAPAVWPREGAPRLRLRIDGVSDEPWSAPPSALVVERLAGDGSVEARIEVPAEAWADLRELAELWSILVRREG